MRKKAVAPQNRKPPILFVDEIHRFNKAAAGTRLCRTSEKGHHHTGSGDHENPSVSR